MATSYSGSSWFTGPCRSSVGAASLMHRQLLLHPSSRDGDNLRGMVRRGRLEWCASTLDCQLTTPVWIGCDSTNVLECFYTSVTDYTNDHCNCTAAKSCGSVCSEELCLSNGGGDTFSTDVSPTTATASATGVIPNSAKAATVPITAAIVHLLLIGTWAASIIS